MDTLNFNHMMRVSEAGANLAQQSPSGLESEDASFASESQKAGVVPEQGQKSSRQTSSDDLSLMVRDITTQKVIRQRLK
jgi:hypothetical protein